MSILKEDYNTHLISDIPSSSPSSSSSSSSPQQNNRSLLPPSLSRSCSRASSPPSSSASPFGSPPCLSEFNHSLNAPSGGHNTQNYAPIVITTNNSIVDQSIISQLYSDNDYNDEYSEYGIAINDSHSHQCHHHHHNSTCSSLNDDDYTLLKNASQYIHDNLSLLTYKHYILPFLFIIFHGVVSIIHCIYIFLYNNTINWYIYSSYMYYTLIYICNIMILLYRLFYSYPIISSNEHSLGIYTIKSYKRYIYYHILDILLPYLFIMIPLYVCASIQHYLTMEHFRYLGHDIIHYCIYIICIYSIGCIITACSCLYVIYYTTKYNTNNNNKNDDDQGQNIQYNDTDQYIIDINNQTGSIDHQDNRNNTHITSQYIKCQHQQGSHNTQYIHHHIHNDILSSYTIPRVCYILSILTISASLCFSMLPYLTIVNTG